MMKKNKRRDVILVTVAAMLVSTSITACADMNNGVRPPTQIMSCPPGLVLICESRQQRELSKGGAEEEIPQHEFCRCEPVLP